MTPLNTERLGLLLNTERLVLLTERFGLLLRKRKTFKKSLHPPAARLSI